MDIQIYFLNYRGIKEYIKLWIAGLFMNSFKWCILEFSALLCGYIINPNIALSTDVVIGNIQIFIILIALGNGTASSIRIGKYIGANMKHKAKQSLNACLFVALFYKCINCIFKNVCFNINYLFTTCFFIFEYILWIFYYKYLNIVACNICNKFV